MAPNTLDFKCALVTGGGGGIGKALAQHLVSQGKKVIIAGRTEKNLQESSKEIGCAAYYVLDTGDMQAIPKTIQKITREHPELDCLINNAGVQRPLDFNETPAEDFLGKADQEIDINIRGPMHLIVQLLPHLKTKPHACIMNVSSVLGFLPFSVINPVYNGTKAWLHMFTMTLRTQLAKDGDKIKVVEIVPPMVGTDLHREREDPDDNKKEKNDIALTVDEFMDAVAKGWKENKDVITAGPGEGILKKWDEAIGQQYEKMAKY
ncbi:hypothetical protein ANO11243_063330 [Dothideomycetidae sp. 11243]|nr:hypothetical protein ANO11243_063330 [fungal sp. No.11243]